MITTRSLLTAFLLAPLCALTAMAQTKPNFTGTWKLNQQKSKFAGDGPEGVTIEFNHQDNNLTEAFTHFQGGGENTIEAKYTIGGKGSEGTGGGEGRKTHDKWDGDAHVIDWERAVEWW